VRLDVLIEDLALDPFPQYGNLTLPEGDVFEGRFGPLFLSDRTVDLILPRRKIDSWKWICENVHTHKGQPFNFIDFPWVEGICDAWDDPLVRRIFFMAGSRLGKTETFLSLMLCAQHHDPDVGMIGGSTEGLVIRTIGDRFYGMLEKTHATRDLCPPPHRRNRRIVRTAAFIIYGAWSGSPTTLGDLDPRYLQALELDKWTKNSSEEADPAELFFERGAEIPDRKLAAESTPTIKGLSRIDKYVSMGTNRRFHVPCPKCQHRQALRRNTSGNAKDGGLWWDRQKDGTTTPTIAAETARYICEDCAAEWGEENRKPAIRRGIWVAPGQVCTKEGELQGRPNNAGPDESFALSRMYGPTFSFGDYARSYVRSMGDPELERSFANNWDGETWVPIQVELTWEQLSEKLCVGDWPLGTCPAECIFVTTAIDVQIDHFVLTSFGWDRLQRGHLIQYGTVPTWTQVKEWCYAAYPHLDGGRPIPSFVNLIDSRDGNRKDEIVEFAKSINKASGPFVWPSMGSKPGSMNLQMFRKLNIDNDPNISRKSRPGTIEGMSVVMINTTYTQEWLDNAMARRKPGDPMSLIFPKCMAEDRDFFEQLLNESYNPDKGLWVRVDTSTIPVDFRDCVRYARAAAEVYCNGQWVRIPATRPVVQETAAAREKRQAVIAGRKQDGDVAVGSDDGRKAGFIRRPSGGFFTRRR
jgi:phage terminase large subunit GpA-like protein